MYIQSENNNRMSKTPTKVGEKRIVKVESINDN